jgi:TonB family protein
VPSGRATLRSLSREPFLRDDGRLDTDSLPTEWMPRLLNLAEFYRELVRRYPVDLRDAGVAGTVDLRIRVLEDGTVEGATARVLRSSHERFTPVALAVLGRMRFRPAVRNGHVSAVWVTLPIQFQTME